MNYKRIWKTGLLAVAVTIACALFAYRVADWSKGLNSEMTVLGQGTNTNGCSTLATGTSSVQTTKIVPQMALGSFDGGLSKYSTVIQIVNTSGADLSISGNFYTEAGAALDTVPLTAGGATITNGVLAPTTIAKDGVFVISGGGAATASTLGWGRITACGTLSISTFFELRDGSSNVLYSRVGVAASPANMKAFVIPRVRDVQSGLDVGFALVNTGSSEAVLTAELKDAAGNTMATKTITMAAGGHQAAFTKDVFSLTTEPNVRSYQYIKFSSNSPTFAAIALAFEGPTQTSFPVDVLQ